MKEAIRNQYKPRTLDELESGIKHFWVTKMTPEFCTRYIEHINTVSPAVVAAKGQATGY